MDELLALPANLPAPTDDGAANHLMGTAMPQLALRSTSGKLIDLHNLGSGRTVIYIYPMTARPGIAQPVGWDAIPGARGCTAQSCNFRDHFAELVAAGAHQVFGLSRQDSDYQSEVVARLHLPFALLSDVDGQLGDAMALPSFHVGSLTLYRRLTMVVRNAKVEKVFYPVFPPDQHAEEVLTWLKDNPVLS